MGRFAEELRRLRELPGAGPSADEFVARVMASCTTGVAPAPEPTRPRRLIWRFGSVLAVAAMFVLGVVSMRKLRLTGTDSPAPSVALPAVTPSGVTARGGASDASPTTVQAFVGHAAPGAALPLLDGATLRPGDGILIRYSNPSARRVYLMVFALDEQRTVHWLHPAYLDESSNPTSLELAREVTDRVLPEVAEPENPAPGALRVYALLSATPLDVKGVESRLDAATRPIPELFPQVEVEEWRCAWLAK